MTQRIPYYDDLLEAFARPGCAVCRLLAESADKLVDAILYEGVNDIPTRQSLNEARGYCGPHAELMVRSGSALGVTIMMDGVLKMLLRILDANPVDQLGESKTRSLLRSFNSHTAVQKLSAELAPQTDCPICQNEAELFPHYAHTLLKHLRPENPLYPAYGQSDGLCLLHFREIVGLGQPGVGLTALVAVQRTIWQRLHEEAEEFIRKNDHRFRGEPFGVEKDVGLRSLTAVSGTPIRQYIKAK